MENPERFGATTERCPLHSTTCSLWLGVPKFLVEMANEIIYMKSPINYSLVGRFG